MKLFLANCPRCGKDHEIEILKFCFPISLNDTLAICPTVIKDILIKDLVSCPLFKENNNKGCRSSDRRPLLFEVEA